jgi:hypothetical protein
MVINSSNRKLFEACVKECLCNVDSSLNVDAQALTAGIGDLSGICIRTPLTDSKAPQDLSAAAT